MLGAAAAKAGRRREMSCMIKDLSEMFVVEESKRVEKNEEKTSTRIWYLYILNFSPVVDTKT